MLLKEQFTPKIIKFIHYLLTFTLMKVFHILNNWRSWGTTQRTNKATNPVWPQFFNKFYIIPQFLDILDII